MAGERAGGSNGKVIIRSGVILMERPAAMAHLPTLRDLLYPALRSETGYASAGSDHVSSDIIEDTKNGRLVVRAWRDERPEDMVSFAITAGEIEAGSYMSTFRPGVHELVSKLRKD